MRSIIIAATLTLTACATAPDAAPSGPLSFAIAPSQPIPPHAAPYLACVRAALDANTIDREANTVRFHCDGATAQALFDAYGPRSAAINSEVIAPDGAIWRATQQMQQDPSGLDFCRRDNAAYACTIVLNVGSFLDE